MAGPPPKKKMLVWVDVSPFPKGICSGEQWKNPGCLRFISNYTTHIIFRDCDKPLCRSLSNNQYSIMESNKVFCCCSGGGTVMKCIHPATSSNLLASPSLCFQSTFLRCSLSFLQFFCIGQPSMAMTRWLKRSSRPEPTSRPRPLFASMSAPALGSLRWPWEGGWSAPQGRSRGRCQGHAWNDSLALGGPREGGWSARRKVGADSQEPTWKDSLDLGSLQWPWAGGWSAPQGRSRHWCQGQLYNDSFALGSHRRPWEGGWRCSSRPEPTSRPTLLERLPCIIGHPQEALLERPPCIGQRRVAMRRWLKCSSRPEPRSRPRTKTEWPPCIWQPQIMSWFGQSEKAVRRWLNCSESSEPIREPDQETKRPWMRHQHSNRFAVLVLLFPMIHSESCEKGKNLMKPAISPFPTWMSQEVEG